MSTVKQNANSHQPLSAGLLTPAPLKQSNLVSEQGPSAGHREARGELIILEVVQQFAVNYMTAL